MNEGASPQLEHGHTQIAHEILEGLAKCGVSAAVFRLVLAVIRETYGYHEKERRVTRARLAKILGVSERRIRQLLRDAEKANMVVVTGWNIGFLKDWTRWPKAEGPPSAFQATNRKDTLPLFDDKPEGPPSGLECEEDVKPEGHPSGFPDETDETNRKDPLPPKPEGPPSAQDKDRKIERQRQHLSPDPETALDKPGPANHPLAQLVQDTWEALGFRGSPPSSRPAAFSGALRLVDGHAAVVREELIPWINRNDPSPGEGDSEAGWFLAFIKEKLPCPPGVGWRKQSAPSPERQSWEGWPERFETEDGITSRWEEDELPLAAASPDYYHFPTHNINGTEQQRLEKAHRQYEREQSSGA